MAKHEAMMARAEEVLRAFAMTNLPESINGLSVRQLTPRHLDLLYLAQSPFTLSVKRRQRLRWRAQAEDVAQFLWIVSLDNPMNGGKTPGERGEPGGLGARIEDGGLRIEETGEVEIHPPSSILYPQAKGTAAPRSFFQSLRPDDPKHFHRFYRAIDRYYARAMLDKPGRSPRSRPVPTSYSSAMVHRFGAAYGWLPEKKDNRGYPIPDEGTLDMPIARLNQLALWIKIEADPKAPIRSRLRDKVRVHIVAKWHALAEKAGVPVDTYVNDYWIRNGRPENVILQPAS